MSSSSSDTETVRGDSIRPESIRLRLYNDFIAKRRGLLAIVLLCDAFFYKCGYRAPSIPAARQAQGWQPKNEPDAGSRAECVKRNIRRLQDEAQITFSELQTFLQLEVVATPDVVPNHDLYYRTVQFLPVDVMAIVLQMLFKACRDEPAKAVLEKVFVWLCGKDWEQAIVEKDMRVIRREGVDVVEREGLERIPGIDTEFREFFENRGGEEE